jgi:hypothetical protein
MDNQVIYRIVEETRLQCRFALFAYQNLRASVQALDQEKVFFFVHAFLHHAGNVSTLLWPVRPESKPRGEKLRGDLKVADNSALQMRDFRVQLERYDERFEDWVSDIEHRNYVGMNVMPLGTLGDFKPDNFHRSLDPEEFKFHWRGHFCDLRQVHDELRKVEASIQAWLRTHNPW